MLVTKANFSNVLDELQKHTSLAFDTETTILPYWNSPFFEAAGLFPRVFSMQFSTAKEDFYFDFNHSEDKLGAENYALINEALMIDPARTWFIANAPFDLNHCENHGIEFKGTVHCTKAIARVVNNLETSLSLDDLAEKYLGVGKIDVISILKERGHVTKIKKYGFNDKYEEVLHFDRLTLPELIAYGEKDTRLCYDLAQWQLKKLQEIDATILKDKSQKIANVYKNECALTKVISKMGRLGIKIDRGYCEEAYNHEVKEYSRIKEDLDALASCITKSPVDWLSAKQLKPIFDAMGIAYSYTEKGNACFDKDALEDSDAPFAASILKFRYHYKRAHTYFENFIWLADKDDILHADAQQAGTGFGRMSYWNPNLQNVPKSSDKDELNYKVRRCFIPRQGYYFADFDYKGAEYYMLVDYAREMPVVEQLKNGIDPHKELGKSMDLERDPAKTMQFRILYGAGGGAVGRALGYKGEEADRIGKQKKTEYFNKMPGVASLIKQVADAAIFRGFIINWLGRVINYARDTAYKAANGLIQGGVGDMTKTAMVELFKHNILPLLQVHDSLLFEFPLGEYSAPIGLIKETMSKAYPHKVIQMQVDVGYSSKSWADLQKELPSVS